MKKPIKLAGFGDGTPPPAPAYEHGQPIKRHGWTLHWTIGAVAVRPIKLGEAAIMRDGEEVTVTGGNPPAHAASTGRVHVEAERGRTLEYFPSVIGAVWVED